MSGYFDHSYDNKKRFISYWYQINEIFRLVPSNVLEIGIGNGMVSNYLRNRGLNVTTLDIREELSPDIVAGVLDMPLDDGAFDVVACYEVLEHIAYDSFSAALSEIYRVCGRSTVISLPDQSRAIKLLFNVPGISEKKYLVSAPRVRGIELDAYHKWEIGAKGYPLRKIIHEMETAGFSITSTYRIFEHPYHRFFILEKSRHEHIA